LPASYSLLEINQKVDSIIEYFGLNHIKHQAVGNLENRGVSGGQRKRVNIAMELVAEPSIILLDEPTSGLDSSTSFELCQKLLEKAKDSGINVAAAIHSPSPAVFTQFDDFILLGTGGQVIYAGERIKARSYFESIGFTCPQSISESDFFMDVATGYIASEFKESNITLQDLFNYWQDEEAVKALATLDRKMLQEPRNNSIPFNELNEIVIMTTFKSKLPNLKRWLTELLEDLVPRLTLAKSNRPQRIKRAFYIQFFYLLKRACTQLYQSQFQICGEIIVFFVLGFLVSLANASRELLPSNPYVICSLAPANTQGSCLSPGGDFRFAGVVYGMAIMFSTMSIAGNTFGAERVVYWRDRSTGLSPLAYFLAKLVADIPRMVGLSLVLSLSAITISKTEQQFSSFFLFVLLISINSFGISYFISIVAHYSSLGMFNTAATIISIILLSGTTPDLSASSTILGFFQSINSPRWAVEYFWIQEATSVSFPTVLPSIYYSMDQSRFSLIYSFIINFVWFIIAYLALLVANRSK
jgi:ABC-type multidrug transport system ATPase subunit